MKYGQVFQHESVPQWAPYNVDYNELKNLIKAHTSQLHSRAIAIPGHADEALHRFESLFFNELSNQHDRVDLFVKSKADEINRRLQFLQKQLVRLLSKCMYSQDRGHSISPRRRNKFARYDDQIERCGEDIRALQRFVNAQRMAFHKILKKYKKWTGSRALAERFNDEVLTSPKSFLRRDFEPLILYYNDLLSTLRASAPEGYEATTLPLSRHSSHTECSRMPLPPQQTYWNEYDDGSEVEDEPYTVYVDPDAEAFPGAKAIAYVLTQAKKPIVKVRGWLSSSPIAAVRRPLLEHANRHCEEQSLPETDIEEGYASSDEFPTGYNTHYATFPSVTDQHLNIYREKLLFRGMLGCYTAAILLLLVAGLLVITGKRSLRLEVDAGVIVGMVASLLFATLGFGTLVCRRHVKPSWTQKFCVVTTFVTICVLNGMLLVLVVGNT